MIAMKTKKIPQRMCLGCRQSHPKKDMLRIVRSKEGEYSVDVTGKKPGRGAYICKNMDCFAEARKNHGLERSFEGRIAPEIYAQLVAELRTQLDANENVDTEGGK